MQMVDVYPQQSIIVCECALYDLETFLSHQDYSQRHKEEGGIIKVNFYLIISSTFIFYKIEFLYIYI
jgi:hypothetical protein